MGEVGSDGGDDAEVVVRGWEVDGDGLVGGGRGGTDVDLHVLIYFQAGVGGDAEICDECVGCIYQSQLNISGKRRRCY